MAGRLSEKRAKTRKNEGTEERLTTKGVAEVLSCKSWEKEYRDTLKLNRKPQQLELSDGQTAMRCVEEIVERDGKMVSR